MTVVTQEQTYIPKELLEALLNHPETWIEVDHDWGITDSTERMAKMYCEIRFYQINKAYHWVFDNDELEEFANSNWDVGEYWRDDSKKVDQVAADFCLLNFHQAEEVTEDTNWDVQ